MNRFSESIQSVAEITYRWYRNGKVVKGATRATYKVTTKDVGRRLKVTVTAHASGYKPRKDSANTREVKRR